MERKDGIIVLRFHTHNRPVIWCRGSHRGIQQAVRAAASDPENECMILTGTGDFWVAYGLDAKAMAQMLPEDGHEGRVNACFGDYIADGMPLQSYLVFDVNIPTIALINGPGYHMDMALHCDLTICTEDTIMFDVHRHMGFVSGDGVNIGMQETMGSKRAAYYMLTGEGVTAQQALEFGMVNAVVPRDQLMEYGWNLAKKIMRGGDKSRAWRRFMTELVRKPLKKRMADDFAGGFAMEMFAYLADDGVSHSDDGLISMWNSAGIELPHWEDNPEQPTKCIPED